jgi:hypothetical protein
MTTPPLLNWRHSSHWSWDAKPCRHCGGLTHLRTVKGWPAHKVCAEAVLAAQAAELTDQYLKGT